MTANGAFRLQIYAFVRQIPYFLFCFVPLDFLSVFAGAAAVVVGIRLTQIAF